MYSSSEKDARTTAYSQTSYNLINRLKASRQKSRRTKQNERFLIMKFHHVLLSAALFFAAGAIFAKNEDAPGQQKKQKETTVYEEEDLSNDTFEWENKSMTVTVFTANNGWNDYAVCGYKAGDADNKPTYKVSLVKAIAAASDLSPAEAVAGLDVSDEIKANIVHFTENHLAYQFTVEFSEDVERIGLIGGNNQNHLVFSVSNLTSNNGNFFSEIDPDGNALFFGKGQWSASEKFNNGAVFLFSESDNGGPVGQPLPTPVVTLLIALGFGAAFMMYRNRKQAKA